MIGITINRSVNYLVNDQIIEGYQNHYEQSTVNGAPLIQLGCWGTMGLRGLWGLVGQYQYINYNPNNVNATQLNPNLQSRYNIQYTLNNEFLLLLYFGGAFDNSQLYLGAGPGLVSASADYRLRSIFTYSPSITLMAGALQLGYNYFLRPTWFLNLNYTHTFIEESSVTSSGFFLHNFIITDERYHHTINQGLNQFTLSVNRVF